MSKKSNEAETVQKDVVEAQVPKETEKKPLKLYPFEDFYEHPEVIGSTKDMVWAAFHYKGIVGAATIEEAKRMVEEFGESKVEG